MAADAELEAKIVPDESAIEEVEERELELGGGGELSSSQENKREGIISGGFKTALLATGIVGLLASLKPLTATISAILGVIGRTLVPLIEDIADFIRPLVGFANEAISSPEQATENATEFLRTGGLEDDQLALRQLLLGLGVSEENLISEQKAGQRAQDADDAIEGLINLLNNISGSGSGSPDQSDEADKIDQRNNLESSTDDKLGGG